MKYLLVVLAVIAAVAADVSELPSNEYLPPQEYIPPVAGEVEPAHVLTEEGYVYNNPVEARRRYRIRRRRDVSELAFPSNEYLPPFTPSNEYLPPVVVEPQPAHVLTEEGYAYNNPIEARRKYRIRRRRDVSDIQVLPPFVPTNEYLPPVVEEPQPAHVLTEEGYTYNNPVEARRRYRVRRRRDVSELAFPSNEYLPPFTPSNEYLPPVLVDPQPAHVLTEEGYAYNNPIEARKKYRHRRRRDVSDIQVLPPFVPTNEYLPPVVEEPEPAHVLTEEGYTYNNPIEARRRYRIRRRRDVSDIQVLPPFVPTNEYLPPVVEEPQPAHVLTEEGYTYNNPVEARRRYRVRRRRDVSELAFPSNEYLPPFTPSNEYLPPVVVDPQPAHVLTEEGYAYNNPFDARRRYRHRRRR